MVPGRLLRFLERGGMATGGHDVPDRSGVEGRLLRLHLPRRRGRRDQLERDDRGLDRRPPGADAPRPGVSRLPARDVPLCVSRRVRGRTGAGGAIDGRAPHRPQRRDRRARRWDLRAGGALRRRLRPPAGAGTAGHTDLRRDTRVARASPRAARPRSLVDLSVSRSRGASDPSRLCFLPQPPSAAQERRTLARPDPSAAPRGATSDQKLRKRTRRLAERSRQLPATARRRRRRLRKWIQRRRRRYGRAILLRLPGGAERVRGARYEGFRELAQSRPAQAQPGAVEEDVRPPDEPVGS